AARRVRERPATGDPVGASRRPGRLHPAPPGAGAAGEQPGAKRRAGTRSRGKEPAVSRVLSRAIIHLGQPSPAASSNLPGSPLGTGGATTGHSGRMLPYLVLLQAGFTVPRRVTTRAVRSYRTFSPLPAQPGRLRLGGLFSVALSMGSRPPGVTWRPARGSPDFPPTPRGRRRLPGRLLPPRPAIIPERPVAGRRGAGPAGLP